MDKIKSNLDQIKNFMEQRNTDWLHLTVGGEGTGKSTLNAAMGLYFDDTFDAQRMHFTGETFRSQAMDLDPLSAINHDEAIEDMYSREGMKEENRRNIKFLRKCRFLGQFMMLCMPSPREMDKSILRDRVRSVARVVKPGWVQFFTANQIPKIQFNRDGTTDWPEPAFRDSFPNVQNTHPEFWSEYEEKKRRDISEIEKGDTDEDDRLSVKEMAKVVKQQQDRYVKKYNKRTYVDKDLICVDFEVGGDIAKKVKKLAEADLGLN